MYYVGSGWYDAPPMDEADYLAWEQKVLAGSSRLTLRFLPLTEAHITALAA